MTVIRHSQTPKGRADLRAAWRKSVTNGSDSLYSEFLEAEVERLTATATGAVNEALRLECAIEQARARFNESDMRGVRETLDAALDQPGLAGA